MLTFLRRSDAVAKGIAFLVLGVVALALSLAGPARAYGTGPAVGLLLVGAVGTVVGLVRRRRDREDGRP